MARMRLGADYRRLWSAATVSNLGDGVTLAARAGALPAG